MSMRAIRAVEPGGPEVLELQQLPVPSPASEQVLIEVYATSVNRPDIVQRQGKYPPPKGETDVLGLEVAGTVVAVGEDVTHLSPGMRVMALVGGGGYAEQCVAYADHCMPIPEAMSFTEAACVCETYLTAFLNIFLLANFSDGQTALLHGGGGGVNTAAVQLCRTLTPKAKTIVTASTGKTARVKTLGVDLVIDYRHEDFAQRIKEYTDGKGVDLILDHIGAQYLAANCKSLSVGGTLVIIGITSGATAEINLGRLMVKRQRVVGSVLRSRANAEKAHLIEVFAQRVLPAFADRRIVPIVHHTIAFEKASEAHAMMEASEHFGKIVLQVRS